MSSLEGDRYRNRTERNGEEVLALSKELDAALEEQTHINPSSKEAETSHPRSNNSPADS